jgi:transposase
MLYDPTKKQTIVLSSKLMGKIPKGSETPVPTRPKRKDFDKVENSNGRLSAKRNRVGMMEIIDHIGTTSGIDDGIYSNTDRGTAQKILSIARYLLASNGQSLPGILTWQFNHPLPYEDGITEDIYHDLFVRVGRDETLQQNFFANRCSTIKDRAMLAYDSTTISTYSENHIEARYGYNKADDGLKTIKYLMLYSIETRQPVAFTKQPGNLPDVVTIENALAQLSALGLGNALVITDNGYYSEHNLAAFFIARFDFITLVKVSLKWVSAEINARKDDLTSISTACPFDTHTHGVTVTLMREFVKARKYSSHISGVKKGDEETFRRRVYLHLFFNAERKAQEDAAFDADLIELKGYLEGGANIDSLPKAACGKAKHYLRTSRYGGDSRISFNEAACSAAKKLHGFFALASNDEKNPFECLRKYRKRETIESFFESMKRRADGTRARVWDSDTLRGRMFVQFVALCYYEFLANEIRKIKAVLAIPNGDPSHDTAKNMELEKKLRSWLENTSVYLVLQWFDTVEGVNISSKLITKRWTTEITARDRLFLGYLGVSLWD